MAEEEEREEEKAPEAPPPLTVPPEEEEGRHWLRPWIYGILALAVVVLVVFGGRWIYHQASKPISKPTPTRPTSPPPSPTTKPTQPPSTAPSGQSAGQTAAGQGGQITETGPGDVVAIFIGASLAAAALHYIYQLRKPTR